MICVVGRVVWDVQCFARHRSLPTPRAASIELSPCWYYPTGSWSERCWQRCTTRSWPPSVAVINPDRKALLLAVHSLRDLADPNSVVVFHFSGHGVMCNNRHYMMGTDLKKERDPGSTVAAYGVAVHDVVAAIQNCYAGIVLLDACRDSQIGGSWQGDWAELDALPTPARRRNLLIFHACTLGGTASDGRQYSPFTAKVMKHFFNQNYTIKKAVSCVVEEVPQIPEAKDQEPVPEWVMVDKFNFRLQDDIPLPADCSARPGRRYRTLPALTRNDMALHQTVAQASPSAGSTAIGPCCL
ncbi:hypothetical protein WJX72_011675 [[Myrmecia] bisecta]|uniref:Peptidase C14 caspase domain-containing protein n=1 Tax=[Myrmecia] bisecta TaxID=41462 RepID=A0AAW1Q5M5_9CHLO